METMDVVLISSAVYFACRFGTWGIFFAVKSLLRWKAERIFRKMSEEFTRKQYPGREE